MTDTPKPVSGMDEDQLDGHTVDELVDYLERHRTPAEPSIDNSPACQIALGALERLRSMSVTLIDDEAIARPNPRATWVADILSSIRLEANAGRPIPLPAPAPQARLSITEGAVRGLIRQAGDSTGAFVVGRVHILGALHQADDVVNLDVHVHVIYGIPLPEALTQLRANIDFAIRHHTALQLRRLDISVTDVTDLRAAERARAKRQRRSR